MDPPYRHILVSRDADLGIVTMKRPERRNALSEAHMLELTKALRSFGEREDVRAVVLAAAGPVYCAGHDFADMVERDLEGMRRLFSVCTDLMLTIERLPQPVVAQVQGIATAAGCQLVATCDLAVAAEEASFATPGGKGAWFCTTPMVAVSRALGPKRALELLFTGEPIDARTALAWGLVNRVVAADRLADETARLARAASRGSRASKAIGKRAFYDTIDLDLEAAYAHASEVMAASSMRSETREAMHAFLERRRSDPARR
jgi:enoyl-CoA hydratase/carnithine racemase